MLKLATVIYYSIVQGHLLQDGNKRFGVYLATYSLDLNNILVSASNESYVAQQFGNDLADLSKFLFSQIVFKKNDSVFRIYS